MKTIITLLILSFSTGLWAQKLNETTVPETLPSDIELSNNIQKFSVTTTHYNGDIFGNFFNKQQVYGEYTRGLPGGKVKWNNVSVSMSMSSDKSAEFTQQTPISYMDDYTYIPDENMLKADNFTNFTEHSSFTKNLIWDMMAIEGFAWMYFSDLKLNKPFSADFFNGKMNLAGEGFFENKDIQLTYIGVSERNGESCALIEYHTLNNPLEITTEGMEMKGRSHYWGNIWVSLVDKQIEHAVLYEDVIMELLLPNATTKSIINATREITYKRIL